MRLARRLEPLRVGGLARGATTIAAGTGLAQVLTVGSSPILTRLYTPADFGVFAVAASVLAVLITIACLAYDYAIPLPASDVEAANVAALCMTISLAMSVATGVVLWIAGPAVLNAIGAAVLAPYALLLAVYSFAGGVVTTLTAWAVRTRSYGDIAATRLTQAGTLVGVQVGLGLLRAGAPGLLVGAVASGFAGSTRLARGAWRTHAAAFRAVSLAGIRAAAVRYRRFALLSGPSNLLNTLALQAPVLLVVALYGVHVGGQFTLAQRVIALPAFLVAGAVGQAFLGEAARVARERPAELRGIFRRTTRLLALAALGPIVLAAVTAPFAFELVFGAAWRDAGIYTAILAPMYYLQLVTNPTAPTLDILERQDLYLLREVLRLSVLGGVVVGAAAAGLPPLAAVAGVSLAGCAAYLVSGLLSWRAIVVFERRRQAAP